MKRIIYIFITLLVLVVSGASAEIIQLKDGTAIQGEVLESGGYYVVIRTEGGVKKFNTSQILRIDKEEDFFGKPVDVDVQNLAGLSKTKTQLIIKYMEVNGIKKAMQEQLDMAVEKADPDQEALLRKIFNIDELSLELVPLYAKHFEENELETLVAFYESPARQKELDVTPVLMKESLYKLAQYVSKKANQ